MRNRIRHNWAFVAMNTPNNIEAFNRGATLIFAKLYMAFPKTVTVSVELLDSNVTSDDAEVFAHTLIWLEREGYIRVAKYAADNFVAESAVLTEKGLRVLNSTPTAIKQKGTVGQFVLEAAKVGTKELMSKAIGYALSATLN